jgi:soluble lytic murein transglycosylase-like protein
VSAANSSSLEKLAVAAFNAGQGRVASAQQRAQRDGKNPADFAQVEAYLPQSTQEYVQRVMSKRDEFEARFSGEG